jgi:hypothetical protein
MGTSPHRYWLDMKLRQAGALLRETRRSVSDIAGSVGIADPSFFPGCSHGITTCHPRTAVVHDDLVCRMTVPDLSSIRLPWRALGQLVARTLAMGLTGRPMAAIQQLAPMGLAVRSSCDPLHHVEPWLADIGQRLQRRVETGVDLRLDRMIDGGLRA